MNSRPCRSTTRQITYSTERNNPKPVDQNCRDRTSSYEDGLAQMNQEQLLMYINRISFVVSDMLLYLDTHPTDRRALDFCTDHIAMRNHALKEYAKRYGPLTIDTADDAASESWEWVNTPWPWEGRMR